jgi:HxlR-like helix-turn-helix
MFHRAGRSRAGPETPGTHVTPGTRGTAPQRPLKKSTEIVGGRWSLLVVRECSYGVHRFNDIQRNTAATTDIPGQACGGVVTPEDLRYGQLS